MFLGRPQKRNPRFLVLLLDRHAEVSSRVHGNSAVGALPPALCAFPAALHGRASLMTSAVSKIAQYHGKGYLEMKGASRFSLDNVLTAHCAPDEAFQGAFEA